MVSSDCRMSDANRSDRLLAEHWRHIPRGSDLVLSSPSRIFLCIVRNARAAGPDFPARPGHPSRTANRRWERDRIFPTKPFRHSEMMAHVRLSERLRARVRRGYQILPISVHPMPIAKDGLEYLY